MNSFFSDTSNLPDLRFSDLLLDPVTGKRLVGLGENHSKKRKEKDSDYLTFILGNFAMTIE
jgi:hypothetical protein